MIGRGQPGLRRLVRLGHERREPHHVEAEARIALVADRARAGRRTGARCAPDRAAARRCRPRCRCTLPSARNSAACSSRAPSPRRSSSALELRARAARWCRARRASSAIGSAKALLGDRGGHRQARRDRLVLAAERLIDAAHELRAEARRERRARAVDHVGDALEADLRERGDRFPARGAAPRAAAAAAPHRASAPTGTIAVACRSRATAQAQPTVSATATRA